MKDNLARNAAGIDMIHIGDREVHTLCDLILQVTNGDDSVVLQNSKFVSRSETNRETATKLGILVDLSVDVAIEVRNHHQLILAILVVGEQQQLVLLRVELIDKHDALAVDIAGRTLGLREQLGDLAVQEVLVVQGGINGIAILEVDDGIVVTDGVNSLTTKLEDASTTIMTGSNEALRAVSRKDPVAIVRSQEGLEQRAFVLVPDTNGVILRVRNDVLILRMEDDTTHIVGVTTKSVGLPSTDVVVSPDLDGSIIRTGNDHGQVRVEGGPVDATLVTFKNELDDTEDL